MHNAVVRRAAVSHPRFGAQGRCNIRPADPGPRWAARVHWSPRAVRLRHPVPAHNTQSGTEPLRYNIGDEALRASRGDGVCREGSGV